jgi:hypothetical protein
MGDNRTIHLATKEGTQSVNIDLEQDFDFLEVLSLRITQQEAYRIFCANYGVLVGKVKANGGYPIKNAKLSIFIPLDNVDSGNSVIRNIYPFETPTDTLPSGQRYNLLPRDKQLGTPADHTPVGTFPSKYDIMTNETLLYVQEKYYKYTTTTNENGDYMFFGLPTGTQIVHMDVDLSDIGNNSVTPADLMNLGYSESLFESDAKFKKSNDLDQLAQIVGINKTVYIRPFWGDVDECEYGITRADFDTARFVFPKGYLIGSIYTDGPAEDNNSFVPKSCWQESSTSASSGVGLRGGVSRIVRADSLRTPEEVASAGEQYGTIGIIEACRLKSDGTTEYVGKWTTKLDGSFMIPLPLNLGKKIWDEDSQSWVDNEEEGFATFGDYRFKIYWEGQGDGSNEQGVENYYDSNINTTQLILGSEGEGVLRSPKLSQSGEEYGNAYSSISHLTGNLWYGTFYNNSNRDAAKLNRGVLFLPNPYVDLGTSGSEEANSYTFFAEPDSLSTASAPFNMKDQFGNQLGRWSNYTRIRLSAYYTVAQYFNYVSDYDVAVPGRKPEGCFSEGILGAWYNGAGDSVYSTPNKPSVYGDDGPSWNTQSIGTNPWIISRSWIDSDEEIRQFPVNYIFNKYKRKDPRWQGIHLEGDEVWLKNYGGFISNYTTASLKVYAAFNMGASAAFSEQGSAPAGCGLDHLIGNYGGFRGNDRQGNMYCDGSCCNPPQLLYCETGACDCTNVCNGAVSSAFGCGTNDCFGKTDATNGVIDGYWFTTARNFYHFDMDGASGNGNDLIFNTTIDQWESTNHLDGCIGCMDLDTVWEDMANWSMTGRGGSIFNEDATPYSWVMPPGQTPKYDPSQGVDISGTLTYGNMRDTPSPLAKGSNKVTMVGDGVTENTSIMGNTICGGFLAPVWGQYSVRARIPYGGADDCYAGVVGIHYCDTTRKNCDLNANWSYSAATSQFFNTGYDKQSVSWAGFAGNEDSTRSLDFSSHYCPSFITSQPLLVDSHCTALEKNMRVCGNGHGADCGALGAYHQKGGGGFVSWELRLKEGMAVRLGIQPVAASGWGSSPSWCDPVSNCNSNGGNLAIPSLAHDQNLCDNGYGCGYVFLNMSISHYSNPDESELVDNYQRTIGEPIHGSLYFPQYYVGVNDDECCSRSNGDFEGWSHNAPEERHKVDVWENFSLLYAGSFMEVNGTLNYENYTTGQGDSLGGSPVRNGKYYNTRTIGNTDIVEITKEIPNFRLGPNQWADIDMDLPNTSVNLSSDYNYSLILNKSDYGPFFTNQDTQNWPLTYAGGMEELQNKNFAPYDWLDFRLAQQYPPQFDTNEVMQRGIGNQGDIPVSWDWMNGGNWGAGTGKLIYPVQTPYYTTAGNLVESNYNVFRYDVQGFSQGGVVFPGVYPRWYNWLRPMPESWYSTNTFWWKDLYALSTEYKELDGETPGTYSPTTPWSAGETYTNDYGTQKTQEVGRSGWSTTNLNAYPIRKYYYFGIRKNRWTALDELKDVLGNVV